MTQQDAVTKATSDGGWWTLPSLKWHLASNYGVYASEAGISARLRDIRKAGRAVERRLKTGHRGLYEYRVVQP